MDIKDIWSHSSEQNIRPYSETELNEMIVKSARRSMRPIQLHGAWLVVIIAVSAYVIFSLLFLNRTAYTKLLDVSALLIIVVSTWIWRFSDIKMNKYRRDMPIKEWLEYRICEVKKTTHMRSKYKVLTTGISFLSACGFYVGYHFAMGTPINPRVAICVLIGLIIYFIVVLRSLNRKYRRTLDELEQLYKQFEKPN